MATTSRTRAEPTQPRVSLETPVTSRRSTLVRQAPDCDDAGRRRRSDHCVVEGHHAFNGESVAAGEVAHGLFIGAVRTLFATIRICLMPRSLTSANDRLDRSADDQQRIDVTRRPAAQMLEAGLQIDDGGRDVSATRPLSTPRTVA